MMMQCRYCGDASPRRIYCSDRCQTRYAAAYENFYGERSHGKRSRGSFCKYCGTSITGCRVICKNRKCNLRREHAWRNFFKATRPLKTEPPPSKCIVCGQSFTYLAPNQKTCGPECRRIHLNARNRASFARNPERRAKRAGYNKQWFATHPQNRAAQRLREWPLLTLKCEICSALFETQRPKQKTCSPLCRAIRAKDKSDAYRMQHYTPPQVRFCACGAALGKMNFGRCKSCAQAIKKEYQKRYAKKYRPARRRRIAATLRAARDMGLIPGRALHRRHIQHRIAIRALRELGLLNTKGVMS